MSKLNFGNAQTDSNKQAIKFILTLICLYIVFSQGNLFMNSVMNPEARFYNSYISDHFNYIQGLKSALIKPAASIIRLFGFYVIYNYQDVMVVNGPQLRINYSCLGLGVMSFLTAFVLSFPSTWKSTFKMLVIGLVVIYILNIFRIAGLGILLGFFKSQRHNFTYHHEIFNVLVYLCVFGMLYIWIGRKPKAQSLKVKAESGKLKAESKKRKEN
ncbi:exosortase/archaeosortase family protein [Pedobacter sp. UYP30]|uniref:exosortase Y n=1 Tax=Pedobacter sp. UYP30 TaxID=1756400 RepID=UPI0033941E91